MDDHWFDRVAAVMIEKYGEAALNTAVRAVRHYTELSDLKQVRFWLTVASRIKQRFTEIKDAKTEETT